MDNYQIADAFSLLSKLMDIHGENSFKSKSYASAAFTIEKCSVLLSEMPKEKIASIKGIGQSASGKIIEILETGQLKVLNDIIFNTPPGIMEMLRIKGIGPKKIHTIWKEMEIETVGELLYACQENRLKMYKGFGEKTQQAVADTIRFYFNNKELHLYVQLELLAEQTRQHLNECLQKEIFITGEFKRQCEIISFLDYVVEEDSKTVMQKMETQNLFALEVSTDEYLLYKTNIGVNIRIFCIHADDLYTTIVRTSSSAEFYEALFPKIKGKSHSEQGVFENAGLPFFPASLREDPAILQIQSVPELIQPSDIKGIIHCHSNWSDGSNTIEELCNAAISSGIEYLVISDHSKSAFYANGLFEERIAAQHQQIDELNKKLHPFRIFKSIESDILNDGSLDYSDTVLSTFDMVIASVHSNLKMTEEKAMMRLLKAIENPYTTILGHMTGRLLLSRHGYPVDHKKISEACVANDVVMELNAHPNRLDIDWRHIGYALEKGAMISIDPDAHFIDGLNDTRYGVLVAQKAGVTKKQNLSSYSLAEIENFMLQRKIKKGISV